MVEPLGGVNKPSMFCRCSQSVTDVNLHQHMAQCHHLQEDFGSLYQSLGQCHEAVMNKQTIGLKKIAALNLKSMLNIFCLELDNIIRDAGGAPVPQPAPVQ